MLFYEECEQNVVVVVFFFLVWTILKALMKMVTLFHVDLIFVKSLLNVLFSSVLVFLCPVCLSIFANSYKAEF